MRSIFQTLSLSLFTLGLFGLGLSPQADAKKYSVAKGTILQVDISHPAKHVVAKSKKVSGEVTLGGPILKGKPVKLSGEFKVKVTTLRSGNRRRDRAMWSALGKSRQKRIKFSPTSLTLNGATGTLKGTFTINKKSKEVTLNVSGASKTKAGWEMTVAGDLLCSSFAIKRPSLLFVKIKDKVTLKLTLKLK